MDMIKQWFKNLPIQRKISVAILLTCGTALWVTALGIFLVQVLSFRRSFVRDLEMISSILADQSSTANVLKDRKAAEDLLRAVHAKSHLVWASIDLANTPGFAVVKDARLTRFPEVPGRDGFQAAGRYLALNRPIIHAGQRVGTLHLVSDYQTEFRRSLSLYAVVLGIVVIASTLLALALSRRLQRLISAPILRLAAIAEKVAATKDYSLRVPTKALDEVGQLTKSFNEMLAKTESGDAALRRANLTLEREVMERQRTEEALQISERFLHSLIESLPQSIIRKDLAGRFTFANEFFCRTVGRPLEQVIGKTDADLFPAELAAKFRRDDEHVIATAKQFETTEESQLGSGKKVYVQVIKTPLFDTENRPVGLQGIFWDVTERRENEEAIERLHKELLLTSRQAGMAEVATGVLHNVGNVLNSVNVSVDVIEKRLRQSRVGNVSKALALIREHRGDLAHFLTEDSKGQMLPGYLETLNDHVTAEQSEMLREIDQLSRNVGHIKEIVAMQQNYARLYGVTETVQACEMVEDAIRMNLGAFERHGITIVREFAHVPPVSVDRHKVLQILVNLMRNAKYAMDELGPPEKRLTVSIRPQEGRVLVSLRDNGIGITPENLTRIFGHGFTTKRDGHGFGLHSGALAAQEMGGKLFAESDGIGKGAIFYLELPAADLAEPAAANTSPGQSALPPGPAAASSHSRLRRPL